MVLLREVMVSWRERGDGVLEREVMVLLREVKVSWREVIVSLRER